MPIKVVDLAEMGRQPDAKRTVLMNGPKFHVWFHVYPNPGDHDEFHCHNSDQTFVSIDGECTMYFPDGGKSVLKPGMAALITGGSFYRLENTGNSKMVMIGTRSTSGEENATISYETRQEVYKRSGEKPVPPKGTSILV